MNSLLAQLSYIVHDRLGLKSQAHSESPLKWTLTIVMLCSPLKRTLAISPEIYDAVGEFIRSLTHQHIFTLISVRFNALKLDARNLFPGGQTTQNQYFQGEGFNPTRIDQQHHLFPGGLCGLLKMAENLQ